MWVSVQVELKRWVAKKNVLTELQSNIQEKKTCKKKIPTHSLLKIALRVCGAVVP